MLQQLHSVHASTGRQAFSLSFVCQVLKAQSLIDNEGEVRIKRFTSGKIRTLHPNESTPAMSPVTPVDVISSLKLPIPGDADNILDDERIMKALALYWKLPFLKIEQSKLNVSKVIPNIAEPFARKHLIIPVLLSKNMLLVALVNPWDLDALEMVQRAAKRKVRPVISTKEDILHVIDLCYGVKNAPLGKKSDRRSFQHAVQAAGDQSQGASTLPVDLFRHASQADGEDSEKSIVQAFNSLLQYAANHHASDIHIEPKRNDSVIRLRIDGFMHEFDRVPLPLHQNFVIRAKALAGMNISEKRKPLDGSFFLNVQDKDIEYRVSTMPLVFGEKVMMRLLDPEQLLRPIENLGFTDDELSSYLAFQSHQSGLLIISGPSGSGKTSTVYSTLHLLSDKALNITTIEEPVELLHEGFNQIAIRPELGLNFETALRHVLRQAPDVLMIGEIRDRNTADQAFKAALSGHLVLSTLHSNNAPSTLVRLMDLHASPTLLESALLGIVSQQLIRTVCEHCAEEVQLSQEEMRLLALSPSELRELPIRKGRGCLHCRGTGYSGRSAIFEIMPMNDELRQRIHEKAAVHLLKRAAVQGGMRTFRESALLKMKAGLTSAEEVLRLSGFHLEKSSLRPTQ